MIKRLTAFAAAIFLAVTVAVTPSFSVKAAPEIGKSTPAGNYITAEDWPEGPDVEAVSAVLIEADTGTVLYAKNPDTMMYPASITKILTALLALEHYELEDVITYSADSNKGLPRGYTTIALQAGEEITVEDSLYALLLYSTNDIANGIGIDMSGSVSEFAKLMNERAKELGAKHTNFMNPSGVEDDDHYTTAYDMCMIMRECIKNEDFVRILSARTHTLETNNKRKEAFTFANKNHMIFQNRSEYYQYCVCGKTGYTDIARNTLITYAEKDGMKLICCVMSCGKGVAYTDSKALYRYGFTNFSVADSKAIDEKYTLSENGIFSEESGLSPNFDIEIMDGSNVVLPEGISISGLDAELNYLTDDPDGCFAEMVYSYEGMKMGSTRLKLTGTRTGEETNTGESESANGSESLESGESAEGNETIGQSEPTKEEGLMEKLTGLFGDSKTVPWILAGGLAFVLILILVLVLRNRKKNDGRIRYDKKVKINWKRK